MTNAKFVLLCFQSFSFLQEECIWKIRTDTMFKSHEVTFKLGEWSQDVTMDGRTVTFKVEQEGPNRLVEIQKGNGKTTKLVRDFSKEGMEIYLKVNDVESSSAFLRQVQGDSWDMDKR